MTLLPISTFTAKRSHMIALLRYMAEFESPSQDKEAVDRLGRFICQAALQRGARYEKHPQVSTGDHFTFHWGPKERGILLMTHMDTVFAMGTLCEMPLRKEDDKLFGPGVLDMKAGIVIALTAIETLQEEGRYPERGVTLLCTSDEETGSETSRALIEELAREHELVLCLEPALADGSLKTWRKGIGRYTIEVIGRAAHAGSEPEAGINAILEMSHQIQKVTQLTDAERGTTLNVGRVRGGTRTNVVPEQCIAVIDVRVMDEEEQRRVDVAFASLQPVLEGARILASGSWNRPPMPHTPQIEKTFSRAQQIAARIGLELTEGGTGGGSDANFVAPLGIPILDGLGAVGGGAHSRSEFIQIASLPERAALLAALIMDW
jgi:glutamate carboxypeptidase